MTPTAPRTAPSAGPIAPSSHWSRELGYDQGRLARFPTELLTIAAQGPLDELGRLVHEDDPAAQLALSLANVAAVLGAAGMTWSDVVQLRVFTTDLPGLLDVYDTLVEHLGTYDARPPATLLEVARLLVPGMTVCIDGLALR
jgi:enamine deaminase RidA (YjgF/YER057c/UK114 family)